MIKIILKENLLLEELSVSEKAVEEIYNFLTSYKKGSSNEKILKVPFKDLPGMQFNKQKNGIVFYSFFYLKGMNELTPNILSIWDENKKSFKEELLKRMYEEMSFDLKVVLDMNPDAEEGRVRIHNEKMPVVLLNYNISKSQDEQSTKEAIRHELQHFSQLIPYYCLRYGREAIASNDPSVVKKIPLKFEKAKIGVGRETTGLSPYHPSDVQSGNITTKQAIERYMISDDEFETWMSDLTFNYFKFLIDKKMINQQKVNNSSAKEIASEYTDKLINDFSFRKLFSRASSRNEQIFRFIGLILKQPGRQEEFPKKLSRYLTKRINNKFPA